jgi:glyoxylase-like metal-dependent hydrolase (beta-lactamase superfamily II)
MKVLIAILILATSFFANTAIAQEADREITPVTGDVYRFRNVGHTTVFTVTGDGVVVTDPIDAEAAAWLKAEIGKLTDQPINTLVYSHSHGDHASGGAVFGEAQTIIAHENAPEAIDGVMPTVRFSERMQFTQGSKTFELTWLGPGHGTDLVAMVIRPENVGFVVDAVASKRLFYRDFPGTTAGLWMQQVRAANALDFDILVGGHGPIGVKSDVVAALAYLEEMQAAVLAGLQAGKTVDELAQSITMDAYSDWINYDEWRELNVRGMARYLQESGQVK